MKRKTSPRNLLRSVGSLVFTAIFFQFIAAEPKTTTTLRNVCAVAEKAKSTYSLTYNKKLEKFIQKVISTTGFSGDRIFISSSSEVKYAVSGLRSDSSAEVVVSDRFNPEDYSYYNAAILVHELAHVFNGDIYQNSGASIKNELQADKYVGFWAKKDGADVDSIIARYSTLPYDPEHPITIDRIKSIKSGWEQANTLYKTTVANNQSSAYSQYLNLYFTISKIPKRKNKELYTVYFHLSSKDKSLPFDSIAPKIDRISYVLDEETFRDGTFVTSYNENKDAFGFTLTGVWDTFPIVCIVYFKDDTVYPIVKEFKLEG